MSIILLKLFIIILIISVFIISSKIFYNSFIIKKDQNLKNLKILLILSMLLFNILFIDITKDFIEINKQFKYNFPILYSFLFSIILIIICSSLFFFFYQIHLKHENNNFIEYFNSEDKRIVEKRLNSKFFFMMLILIIALFDFILKYGSNSLFNHIITDFVIDLYNSYPQVFVINYWNYFNFLIIIIISSLSWLIINGISHYEPKYDEKILKKFNELFKNGENSSLNDKVIYSDYLISNNFINEEEDNFIYLVNAVDEVKEIVRLEKMDAPRSINCSYRYTKNSSIYKRRQELNAVSILIKKREENKKKCR